MELWFSDYHTDDVKLDIKIEKQLFGEDTDFQRIDVFDSKECGTQREVGDLNGFYLIIVY